MEKTKEHIEKTENENALSATSFSITERKVLSKVKKSNVQHCLAEKDRFKTIHENEKDQTTFLDESAANHKDYDSTHCQVFEKHCPEPKEIKSIVPSGTKYYSSEEEELPETNHDLADGRKSFLKEKAMADDCLMLKEINNIVSTVIQNTKEESQEMFEIDKQDAFCSQHQCNEKRNLVVPQPDVNEAYVHCSARHTTAHGERHEVFPESLNAEKTFNRDSKYSTSDTNGIVNLKTKRLETTHSSPIQTKVRSLCKSPVKSVATVYAKEDNKTNLRIIVLLCYLIDILYISIVLAETYKQIFENFEDNRKNKRKNDRSCRQILSPTFRKPTQYRRFSRVLKLTTEQIFIIDQNRRTAVIHALPDYLPGRWSIRRILEECRNLYLTDYFIRLATFGTAASNIGNTMKLAWNGFFCDLDGKIKCSKCEREYTSPHQEIQSVHLVGCSFRNTCGQVGNSILDTYGGQAPTFLLNGLQKQTQSHTEGVMLRSEQLDGVQQQAGTTDVNDLQPIIEGSTSSLLPSRSVQIIDSWPQQDDMNHYYETYGNVNQASTNNEANGILPTDSSSTRSLLASNDHENRVIAVSRASATTSSSYTRSAPLSSAALDLQQQQQNERNSLAATYGNVNQASTNNKANGILPTESSSTSSLLASNDHENRVIAVSRASATTSSSYTRSAPLSSAALDLQQQQQNERNSLAASAFDRNRTAVANLDNQTVSLSTDVRNKIHRQNHQHLNTGQAGKPSCRSSNNTNPRLLADHNGNPPKPKPIQSPTIAIQTLSLQTSKSDIGEIIPEAESQQQQNKYQKEQRGTRDLTKPTGGQLPNQRMESNVSLKSSCSENASSTTQGSVSSEKLSSPSYSSAELKPPDPENEALCNDSETNGGYGDSTQETSEITQDHEEELGSNGMLAADSLETVQSGTDFPNQPDNDTNRK